MEFLKLWEILLRRKRLIFLSFVVSFLAIVCLFRLINPTYKASAKVLVHTQEAFRSLYSALNLTASSDLDEDYVTNIGLATLRPLLMVVISQLQLKDRRGRPIHPDDLIKWSIVRKFVPYPYLAVEQYEDSTRLLEINATSANPEEAARICNMLADLYVNDRIKKTASQFNEAKRFLSFEIVRAKQHYERNLALITEFQKKTGYVDLESEEELLVEKKSSLSDLQLQIAEQQVELTPSHPEYRMLDQKMAALSNMLASGISDLPASQETYARLTMQLGIAETIYQEFLTYLAQIEVAESVMLSTIAVEEPAITPTKVDFPKKIITYVGGLVFSVFWALMFGLFVDYVDQTVRSADDLRAIGWSGLIVEIPRRAKLRRNRLITRLSANSPELDAFRRLRDCLEHAASGKTLKSLAVMSSINSEGRTTVASNLAIAFAMSNRRTALVDLNLRRPAIHSLFGPSNESGVAALLADSDLDTLGSVSASPIENLDVLTSGACAGDPGRLIESSRPRLKEIIAALADSHDIVVIDTPALLSANEAMAIGSAADAAVFVTASSEAGLPMVQHAKDIMERARILVIASVVNKVQSHAVHGHYYRF